MPAAEMIDARPWEPTAGTTTFNGSPMPVDLDLFVHPPASIGPVVSADSEVKKGQTLLGLPAKIGIALVVVIIGIAVVAYLQTRLQPGEKPGLQHVIIGMTAICAPFLALAFAFKPKYMAYIGRDGAAVYRTRGSRSAATGQSVRFGDVDQLQFAQQQRKQGWTEWQMHFVDPGGVRLMTLKGQNQVVAGRIIKSPIFILASSIGSAFEKQTGKKPVQI